MRSRVIAALAALVCVLGSADVQGQEGARRPAREVAPPPLPMKQIEFPPYTEGRLSNGARTIVVAHNEQPVATISIYMPGAGARAEPVDRIGIASMTANQLNKGTTTRSAREIAEYVDRMGAQLSASGGQDWASISVTALTGDIDAALDVMADVLLNPTFPADELEIERQRALQSLRVELSQPAAVASRVFTARVYGDHPYGRVRTAEQLQAMSRDDLAEFHRNRYKPDGALIVVAGDVDAADITRRIEQKLAGWTGSAPATSPSTAPELPARREIVLVHRPGAVQASMRIGHTIVPATHPDWPALVVALHILGGGSSGWLFQELREQRGYTYGAYASGSQRPDPGVLQLSGDVRNEVADSALTLFIELAQRLRNEPVPADQLEAAKAFLTGSFPLTIETPGQIAGQLASARLLGRPDDHVQTWRTRLAAVTAADVQRVARAHLNPERSLIVIAGDAEAIRAKLEPFAPLTVVDEHGNPVAGDDQRP
jgi:zinc protease